MNKSDILSAAALYGARFVAWLDFVLDEEIEVKNGMIVPENCHDGEGVTFAGLTQASDGLDLHNLSPRWVAGSYYNGKVPYWKPVAGLPLPLAECMGNWRVNMGLGGSGKLLQEVLNSRGARLTVDGAVGASTIMAAMADPDTRGLCRALVAAADAHYRDIVSRKPSRAYALNDWLRRDQHLLARFVDTAVPEDAMGPISTPLMPRVPSPRTFSEILDDLQVTPQVIT